MAGTAGQARSQPNCMEVMAGLPHFQGLLLGALTPSPHSHCAAPTAPCLQLTLEAEALRRQINTMRVDLTIYRSSLAFMDSPLQARCAVLLCAAVLC